MRPAVQVASACWMGRLRLRMPWTATFLLLALSAESPPASGSATASTATAAAAAPARPATAATASAAAAATRAPAPPPLPETVAISAAVKELRALYRDDYAARMPDIRLALARKLLDLGRSGKGSPAERCALLREASEVAARAGDLALVHEAVVALATSFAVAEREERARALSLLVPATAEIAGALASCWCDLADEAIAVDDYPLAQRAAQQSDALARRLRDAALAAQARSMLARVRELAEEWKKIGETTDVLGQTPPDAHARLGRFHCLAKGDWDTGLPHLAESDDALLRPLAAAELAATATAAVAAAGEGWADAAPRLRGRARDEALMHASGLLRRALPGLAGVAQGRAEKRLADLQRQLAAAGRSTVPLPPGAVAYLSFERDTWVREGNRLLVLDVTGHGLHGAVTGARPQSILGGTAATFTEEGQGIDLGNQPAFRIAGAMTVSFWLRPDALTGRRNPFSKCYAGEGTITIESSTGMTLFAGINGSDAEAKYEGYASGYALALGTWTHVAVVRDSPNRVVRWYRNGRKVGEQPSAYPAIKPSEQPLLLGRGYAGQFLGQLDEFGLWARALGDDEIRRLHADTAPGR